MSSTTITSVASAIATQLATITGLTVYDHEPKEIEMPAVDVTGPIELRRVDPDTPNSQLGALDWHMTFLVHLYVAQDDSQAGEVDTRTFLAQIIDSIDANPGLSGAVLDTQVTAAHREDPNPTDARRRIVTAVQVDVFRLV